MKLEKTSLEKEANGLRRRNNQLQREYETLFRISRESQERQAVEDDGLPTVSRDDAMSWVIILRSQLSSHRVLLQKTRKKFTEFVTEMSESFGNVTITYNNTLRDLSSKIAQKDATIDMRGLQIMDLRKKMEIDNKKATQKKPSLEELRRDLDELQKASMEVLTVVKASKSKKLSRIKRPLASSIRKLNKVLG